ncbi:hypothetical protein TRVL_09402 [Trypanosoma vivax]|nr:hypothetical protein TRVL_09402 [Trypanosoma vivax]
MCGARWRRVGPSPYSSAKRRGCKFTKNANTCKRLLPLWITESDGLKQRICQPEGQIQRMLGRAKSFHETNGALAADNGLSKAGRVQTATETRGTSAQRSEPNAQLPQRWADALFPAPTIGERSSLREIATL